MPYTLFMVLLFMTIILICANAYLWIDQSHILSLESADSLIHRKLIFLGEADYHFEWDEGSIDCSGKECIVVGIPDKYPLLFDIQTTSFDKLTTEKV